MANRTVVWPGELVQEPAGSMNTDSWQVRIYQASDGTVVMSATEPQGARSHTFALTAGTYHAGVLSMDVNGQPASSERLSDAFTVEADVEVLRSGPVTVEVTA